MPEGGRLSRQRMVRAIIAIPTYNERENIVNLVQAIQSAAPATDILIIDDNSPDGTGQIADEMAARDNTIHVMHRPGKLGLGTAYIAGFHYAIEQGYDFVFEMDADFSHNPTYLPRFFELAGDADVVIGSRYVKGGGTPNWSPLRKFISGGGNMFARAMLGIPVHDCTAGFRCYRTAALCVLNLDAIRAQGYAFQVEMTYNFWKSGFRIRELPIIFEDRRVGKSKMSRKIFIEAFLWVLRARVTGDAEVRRRPPTSATLPEAGISSQVGPAGDRPQ
ncbi:MAG TPA: polyprenol monophosphomannose synthase [Ktedonobacterales bacterium]